MFKNRAITVKMEKSDKNKTEESPSGMTFEEKTEVILETIESLAVKAFIGLCIYVVLDTRRQVAVAIAQNTTPKY